MKNVYEDEIIEGNNILLSHENEGTKCDNEATRDAVREKTTAPKFRTVWNRINGVLDLDLLIDIKFLNIIIGISLVYSCSISFAMLFPFFLRQTINLDRAHTAMCMSILSCGDMIARITIPIIAGYFHLGNRCTFLIGAITIAIARSRKLIWNSHAYN